MNTSCGCTYGEACCSTGRELLNEVARFYHVLSSPVFLVLSLSTREWYWQEHTRAVACYLAHVDKKGDGLPYGS